MIISRSTTSNRHDHPKIWGLAGVDPAADMPPRHRVQALADLDVDVRSDRATRPGGEHELHTWRRVERLNLLLVPTVFVLVAAGSLADAAKLLEPGSGARSTGP
jgi:hypothetical protein